MGGQREDSNALVVARIALLSYHNTRGLLFPGMDERNTELHSLLDAYEDAARAEGRAMERRGEVNQPNAAEFERLRAEVARLQAALTQAEAALAAVKDGRIWEHIQAAQAEARKEAEAERDSYKTAWTQQVELGKGFRDALRSAEAELDAAKEELRVIANVSKKDWDDPTDFEAWARNRARHTVAKLDALVPPSATPGHVVVARQDAERLVKTLDCAGAGHYCPNCDRTLLSSADVRRLLHLDPTGGQQ